jgi:hypothetical protein
MIKCIVTRTLTYEVALSDQEFEDICNAPNGWNDFVPLGRDVKSENVELESTDIS